MSEPVVFQPAMMRSVGDCAICCLVMLCGKSYAEVLWAVPRNARKRCVEEGLSVQQIINVAAKLGTTLDYHEGPEEDDEEDEEEVWETFTGGDNLGLLYLVRMPKEEDGHTVVYMRGIIYDPARVEIWLDVDAFLAERKWKVEGFLWRK